MAPVAKSNKQKKKSNSYTAETLKMALEDIRERKCAVRQTSRKYGIPKSTLLDRVQGRVTDPMKTRGPDPILGYDVEKKVVEWIISITKCAFPMKKSDLLDTVQKIIKDTQKKNPFKDDRPGQTWYSSFLKRNPEIYSLSAEGRRAPRSKLTLESTDLWFRGLESYLRKTGNSDILEFPERIFNGVECAFVLCSNSEQVLAPKGHRLVVNQTKSSSKDDLTVSITFNALGQLSPPLVLLPYHDRPPTEVADNMPTDWILGKSESGWMRGEVFFEYIANDFDYWVTKMRIKKPILLLLDGHKSHLSLFLSDMCNEVGIILYALPQHVSLLQPAEVNVFAPLKADWENMVKEYVSDHDETEMTKIDFFKLIEGIITNSDISSKVIHGFRLCGLFPFNADAIQNTEKNKTGTKKDSRTTSPISYNTRKRDDLIKEEREIRKTPPSVDTHQYAMATIKLVLDD